MLTQTKRPCSSNSLGRRDSLLAALLPPVSNHSIAWFQKTLEPGPGQLGVTESIVETLLDSLVQVTKRNMTAVEDTK